MPSSRTVGRISRSMLRLISEYSICSSAIGCTAWARRMVSAPISDRPMWRTYPAFTRSAIAPTVSSIGTAGIEPRRLIEVDVIRAEPLQRIRERRLHRRGPRVEAEEVTARIALRAELHLDERALAPPAFQRLAQQQLVVPHAVEIAGVEQGDRRARAPHGWWRCSRPYPAAGHRTPTSPCSRGRCAKRRDHCDRASSCAGLPLE